MSQPIQSQEQMHAEGLECGIEKCQHCCKKFIGHKPDDQTGNWCEYCDYDCTPDLIDAAEWQSGE